MAMCNGAVYCKVYSSLIVECVIRYYIPIQVLWILFTLNFWWIQFPGYIWYSYWTWLSVCVFVRSQPLPVWGVLMYWHVSTADTFNVDFILMVHKFPNNSSPPLSTGQNVDDVSNVTLIVWLLEYWSVHATIIEREKNCCLLWPASKYSAKDSSHVISWISKMQGQCNPRFW